MFPLLNLLYELQRNKKWVILISKCTNLHVFHLSVDADGFIMIIQVNFVGQ